MRSDFINWKARSEGCFVCRNVVEVEVELFEQGFDECRLFEFNGDISICIFVDNVIDAKEVVDLCFKGDIEVLGELVFKFLFYFS